MVAILHACYDRSLKRSWSTLQTSTGKSCMCKSGAVGERSFSAARKLKTWLRSTMTQERFSNLKQPQKENRQICLTDVANILKFAVRNYKTGKKFRYIKSPPSSFPPPPNPASKEVVIGPHTLKIARSVGLAND